MAIYPEHLHTSSCKFESLHLFKRGFVACVDGFQNSFFKLKKPVEIKKNALNILCRSYSMSYHGHLQWQEDLKNCDFFSFDECFVSPYEENSQPTCKCTNWFKIFQCDCCHVFFLCNYFVLFAKTVCKY